MIIKLITDNQGKTLDRYTVYFWDNTYLSLSHNCHSPQGVSMWGEHQIPHSEFMKAVTEGTMLNNEQVIDYEELPMAVREHLTALLSEYV